MGQELKIFEIILQSGFVVQSVLISLIFSSVLSWAVILKKRKELKNLMEANQKFKLIYGDAKSLKELLKINQDLPFSALGAIFESGYQELMKISEKFDPESTKVQLNEHFSRFGLGAIERGLQKGINTSNDYLDRRQTILASIGSVTPYIGLFGTVWGIINAFSGLADGGASLEKVAPGIAEALVATAMGLFAAIPAVLFYNHFASKKELVNSEMNSFGQDFLNMVERSVSMNRKE
jgi:biopolymer transport protein TolQ